MIAPMSRRIFVAALVFVSVTAASAQTSTITPASVRAHMEFLASDALNGRGSGTHDELVAATYIASRLREWGLQPLGDEGGYVLPVGLSRTEVEGPPVLSAGSVRYTHGEQILVQSIAGAETSGPLERYRQGTPVSHGAVLLLPEQPLAVPQTELAPAAIVLTAETPAVRQRWAATAARGVRGLPTQIIGLSMPSTPARAARVVLSTDAYAAVAALADGTTVTLTAPLKLTTGHTYDVLAELKGSDPARAAEVILLTAHLDHLGVCATTGDTICNGADDDASGTTAVLELAEALAKGARPKRTIIFAWFGSEEAGGYGATYFVRKPPVPLDQIVANLEFEMIGRPDTKVPPHTLWLTGYERTNLGPELARHGARLVQDPHPEQNFFQRSDNITLARDGVVAQTVSSFGLHPDYHRPSDDLSHIDFAHMTESIRSMLAPVRWLANTTFKPTWKAGMMPAPRGGGGE